MALFKQWQRLNQPGVNCKQDGSVTDGVEEQSTKSTDEVDQFEGKKNEDVIEVDGLHLKSLIKDYARECIREELANKYKIGGYPDIASFILDYD